MYLIAPTTHYYRVSHLCFQMACILSSQPCLTFWGNLVFFQLNGRRTQRLLCVLVIKICLQHTKWLLISKLRNVAWFIYFILFIYWLIYLFILAYFLDCKTVRIFAYSSTREQSNKRYGMGLKTESDYRFLYWFWEKNRLFCSLLIFFSLFV